jgi:predicted small integral membrane protein
MENENAELVPAKRPQFLTVLCILTFIGAGLGLLGGFWNLIKAPTALEEIESIQSMGTMPEGGMFADMMESAVLAAQNAYPLAITTIVSNLLCLLGAMFMWKQRKNGYYIYVAAQLMALIVPTALIGFGGAFSGFMVIGAIFPIAFIVMYGVNMKHMS